MRWLILCLALLRAAPVAADPVNRCMNLSNALEAPQEGDWGYVITRDHPGAIAAAGFDTVRLPARVDAHFREGRIDPAFLARLDQVIGWAEAEGLQVILDLHHYEALMADPTAEADRFVAIWDALGAHYAGHPDTLIFELVNEPTDALTTARAADLQARVIARLRPAHPNRWIITSGGGWGGLDGMLALPPPSHRELRSFHYYDPWEFTHQLAPWTGADLPARRWGSPGDRARVTADMARAAAPGWPVLLGEFGVYRGADPALRADWIGAVRRAAEAEGIGWCHWGFAAEFRAFDRDSAAWMPGIRAALLD